MVTDPGGPFFERSALCGMMMTPLSEPWIALELPVDTCQEKLVANPGPSMYPASALASEARCPNPTTAKTCPVVVSMIIFKRSIMYSSRVSINLLLNTGYLFRIATICDSMFAVNVDQCILLNGQ